MAIVCKTYSQKERDILSFNELKIEEKKEIVINQLLRDTIKYREVDIHRNISYILNLETYSEVYMINSKHSFKFDIVDATCVNEFVDQYLRNAKVIDIKKISIELSTAMFGTNGRNGVTLIKVKRLRKIKVTNCSLTKTDKKKGNNWTITGNQ